MELLCIFQILFDPPVQWKLHKLRAPPDAVLLRRRLRLPLGLPNTGACSLRLGRDPGMIPTLRDSVSRVILDLAFA